MSIPAIHYTQFNIMLDLTTQIPFSFRSNKKAATKGFYTGAKSHYPPGNHHASHH